MTPENATGDFTMFYRKSLFPDF